jgi:hypothetical protein
VRQRHVQGLELGAILSEYADSQRDQGYATARDDPVHDSSPKIGTHGRSRVPTQYTPNDSDCVLRERDIGMRPGGSRKSAMI